MNTGDFTALFYERVPEGRATRHFWCARAYSDWHNFTHVMIIWPLHYAVQCGWWLNSKWAKYRHQKSWIDQQIDAAVKHSERQDVRRLIHHYLKSP